MTKQETGVLLPTPSHTPEGPGKKPVYLGSASASQVSGKDQLTEL